jgi:diguanylate cyclase (GGDEF)-like protein
MATRQISEPADALALRARVQTLKIGTWPSIFTCLFSGAYYLWTWNGPHRSALLAICLVAAGASVLLARVPIEPLLRGRWREPFFLSWSATLILMITTGAWLDGGVHSPLTLTFFLPLAYAALSYPLRPMLAVGAMNLVAFLGLAIADAQLVSPYVFFFASSLVAAAWMCAWQAQNLDRQRRELAWMSRVDPLTGALNRRGFEERAAAHLEEARRDGRSLSVVLIDLDRFKDVNDTLGHAAGDRLLCWVVDTLRRNLRPGDAVGRLGGDEFAVFIDGDGEQARDVADRLLARISVRTAASVGIASSPLDGQTLEQLHHVADVKLYAHKQRATPPGSSHGPLGSGASAAPSATSSASSLTAAPTWRATRRLAS